MTSQFNSFISDISNGISWFANSSWIYPGILIASAVFLTIYFGFFQIRRLRRMTKCYFQTESHGDKSMSPAKIFLTSLSTRFGIGNIIGVGVAIIVGGPGIVLWMVLISFFCMAIGFVESSLSQIYHEKDNARKHAVLYRGGTPYYIYKGLGKSFKWLAISYVIFSILAKGVFIISSTTNAVGYIGVFAFLRPDTFFTNPNNSFMNSQTISPIDSSGFAIWIFIVIYLILIAITIIGGVKKVVKFSSKLMPITFWIFVVFIFIYLICNFKYLPSSLHAIFVGFIDPKKAIPGVAGATAVWHISQTIKSGATRGIFAHEAGQGSTTFISSVAKLDNPIRMGYGQALAVGVDVAIICAISGLFFTTAIIKCHDTNLDFFTNIIGKNLNASQQAIFATWASFNYLPIEWTHWLTNHGAAIVNRIFVLIFFLIIFSCGFSIVLGAIIITEYSISFFFRNKHVDRQIFFVGAIRVLVMIGIGASPFINMLSASVFSIADLSVALCFFSNLIAIILLAPVVKRVKKDFNKQYNKITLDYVKSQNIVIPTQKYLINIVKNIKYKMFIFSITKWMQNIYFEQKELNLNIHLIPANKVTWAARYKLWKLQGKMNIKLTFNPKELKIYNREFDWYGYKNALKNQNT